MHVFIVLNNVALTYHRWGNISAAVANYKRGLTLIREQANVSRLSIAKSALANALFVILLLVTAVLYKLFSMQLSQILRRVINKVDD